MYKNLRASITDLIEPFINYAKKRYKTSKRKEKKKQQQETMENFFHPPLSSSSWNVILYWCWMNYITLNECLHVWYVCMVCICVCMCGRIYVQKGWYTTVSMSLCGWLHVSLKWYVYEEDIFSLAIHNAVTICRLKYILLLFFLAHIPVVLSVLYNWQRKRQIVKDVWL